MFTENLSPFFATSEFASNATLGAVAVKGILEPGYASATLDGFGVAAGSSPTFTLPSVSVPVNPEGMTLVVTDGPGAATYRVGNARHDGTGVCTLDLLET
jgi:hypothetical protein